MDYDVENIRTQLRNIKEERNLDVTNWARAAGLTEGTLRSFLREGGTKSLKVDTFIRLISVLGMQPSTFFEDSETRSTELSIAIQRAVYKFIEDNALVLSRDITFQIVASLMQQIKSIEDLDTRGTELIKEFIHTHTA